MKKTSKVIAMLLSLTMILSVCGMMTVFAEGEYAVKYGANNVIRIENSADNLGFEAGVARTFEFNVPADGEYFVILGKAKNAEGKYDIGINLSLSLTQGEETPQVLDYTFNKGMRQDFQAPVERVGNNVPMNVTLTAGACTLSLTAETETNIYYIELRDTRLQITEEKQTISSFDFKEASLNGSHVNEQVAYGTGIMYPDGYTLVGNYLDAAFDQSTTDSNRRVRYIHILNACFAEYDIDVQTAGYYQISTFMNLYTTAYPKTSTLTVQVDGNAVSDLSYIKESKETPSLLIPSRAIYLTAGRHTLRFANNSSTGAYVYYITAEQVDPNKAVKVDDNFTRIEFAKQEGKATLNSEDGLSVTKTVELVGGTYAVFVKKPVEFYGADCTYDVTFSQNGETASNVNVAAATNGDSNNKGFAYERVGDNVGTTFTVPDGEVDFTFAVSKDCDVEYIDLRRLELPLTGGKQAIAVADFSIVNNLGPLHCSQQFGTGSTSHVLTDYPLIGDYFSNKITPTQKYFPIHLSKDATVGYTVDVAQTGWYQFGVVINTYKSNGILSLYADDNVIDAARYTYTTTPQPDLTYAYNSVYLTEGRHTIKLSAAIGGIYLYRFTTEKLDGDPVYEFSGESATIMQLGMNSEAAIDGDYRLLDSGDSASFKLNNTYTDPQGKNEYTLKLAVDTSAVSDAVLDVQIGETLYSNIQAGGKFGDVNAGTIVLPEGENIVTVTSKSDGVKFKSFSVIETVITTNELGNTLLSILRASAISEGVTPDAAGSASFTAEQFVEFDVNAVAAGAYTVCMTAKSPQTGFTVYVDDVDYTDSEYLLTQGAAVNNSKNTTMLKNAATNIHLTEGIHKIKIVFHDVDNEAVTHAVSEVYLRRVDKTVDSKTRIQLGTWDYVAFNSGNPGWNLAAQNGQGLTYKGDELFRNVVFMGNVAVTYEFNVAESGFYKISNFGTGPENATQKSTYAIDGGIKTSETEFGYIGTGSDQVVENIYLDYAYLTVGTHTLTIYATNPSEQAVRMNMTQITWVPDVLEAEYDEETRIVSFASSGLDVTEDGTIYLAAYSGNRLIGMNAVDVKAGTKAVKLAANVRVAPDMVKVLTFNSSFKPLAAALEFVGEDLIN